SSAYTFFATATATARRNLARPHAIRFRRDPRSVYWIDRYRQVVGEVGNKHIIRRDTSTQPTVTCGGALWCWYSLRAGSPHRRTSQPVARSTQSSGVRTRNVVYLASSSCSIFGSTGITLNVFGCTCGMWYDSSEFSRTTFQLHGNSCSQAAANRNGGPNDPSHLSHSGPTNSRRFGAESSRQTNTISPQVAVRNLRRHEFSRSQGRNARASGISPVRPSRLNSHPWY